MNLGIKVKFFFVHSVSILLSITMILISTSILQDNSFLNGKIPVLKDHLSK